MRLSRADGLTKMVAFEQKQAGITASQEIRRWVVVVPYACDVTTQGQTGPLTVTANGLVPNGLVALLAGFICFTAPVHQSARKPSDADRL